MSFRQSCTTSSRYIFIVINVLMKLAALTIVALALWIRFDSNFERALRTNILNPTSNYFDLSEIKSQIRDAITVAFWVIIGFSIATGVLSFIGVVGAITQKRATYMLYVLLLAILILLQIAIGVFVIVYRPMIRGVTNRFCSLSFQYNTGDAAALADRYQCCGDGTQNAYNQQCFQSGNFAQRDCPTAVWNRLDFTLMISGIVLLIVLIVETLAAGFGLVAIVNHRYGTLVN